MTCYIIYKKKNWIFNGSRLFLPTSRGQYFNSNPINRISFIDGPYTFMSYTNYVLHVYIYIYLFIVKSKKNMLVLIKLLNT